MHESSLSETALLVRHNDPDRFLTILFAPVTTRDSLFAVYALNVELSLVSRRVSEPMLGRIRLQWWRETLDPDAPPPNHPVAREVRAAMANHPQLSAEILNILISAYEDEFEETSPQNLLTTKGEALAQAIAAVLGAEGRETEALSKITTAWEVVFNLARNGIGGREEGREGIRTLVQQAEVLLSEARLLCPRPHRGIRAGFLPAVPVTGRLHRLRAVDYNLDHPRLKLPGGRPFAVAWAGWTGRY